MRIKAPLDFQRVQPMQTEACPFCSISTGRILAETALTLTIRDRFPVSPDHTLIVPKRHFADLFEATSDEIREIWQALAQVAGQIRPADGFNIGVNVGAAAGQTVMHLHIHLIPRYAGDQPDPRGGIRRIFPEQADYWNPERS